MHMRTQLSHFIQILAKTISFESVFKSFLNFTERILTLKSTMLNTHTIASIGILCNIIGTR